MMAAMPIYGITLENFLLQNQKSFKGWILVYSIEDSRSIKFVQMMLIGWHLTFLQHGQICVSMDLYGVGVKNNLFFFQYVFEGEWLKLTMYD